MAGETILSIAYGLDVLPKDDPYIAIAEEGVHSIVVAGTPGAFLVDTFPWLKYVPDWMPFAGFKRKAKEWHKVALTMVEKPFEAGKRKFVSVMAHQLMLINPHRCVTFQESGDATPSFISYSLGNMNENHDPAYQEEVIKGTAGAMYAGTRFICIHRRSHTDLLTGPPTQPVPIRHVSPVSIPRCIYKLHIDYVRHCFVCPRPSYTPGSIEESTGGGRRCHRFGSPSRLQRL